MSKYDINKYYSGEYDPGPHLRKVREDHKVDFFIMSLKELVNKALFIDGECIRHDVIVRFIAVEHYMLMGIVDPLYKKLQERRMATMAKGRKVSYNPKRLTRLVDAFKRDGFRANTPIILGLNEQIIEGAHRLACCIYFNINPVPIEKWSDKNGSQEHRSWFIQNFTEEELKIIDKKKEELYEQFCTA